MSASSAQPAGYDAAAPRLHGLLVEFDTAEQLMHAARQARDAGYQRFDAHSPYPIHGMDAAAGIRMTKLPWIVFLCALAGAGGGLFLQWWTNATYAPNWDWLLPNWLLGYTYRISGKPFFSLPANIPIMFELTILFSGIATVLGMFIMNNLPLYYNAWLNNRRFLRATTDGFFLSIPASDPAFRADQARRFADGLGGQVEEVFDEAQQRAPRFLTWSAWILVSLLLLPPVYIAKARYVNSPEPRIHPIQDMDNQPRYKSQQPNPAFADGRAMRPPVDFTVARGDWPVDEHWAAGARFVTDPNGTERIEYYDGYPEGFAVTVEVIEQGQTLYNTYCAMCHGYDGHGAGIVHERAVERGAVQTGWRQPTDLNGDNIRQQPHGQIYYTIANGRRTMSPYRNQIKLEDRWKIVTYLRALQRSTAATIEDVPPDKRPLLR